MNTHIKVQEWAERMEYQGRVPDKLQNICNASTAPLWEELVQNVMQKRQVQHIRNNIIINRLNNNKLSYIQFPIKELELWERKRNLEEELYAIKIRVSNNEHIMNELSEQNKIKYLIIENTKRKIRENELKRFVFEKKAAKYEKEIEEIEEKLTFCKNLTPIESHQSKPEILHTLNECVKKIEKLALGQDLNEYSGLCTTPLKSCGNFSTESQLNYFKDDDLCENVKQVLYRNNNFLIWNVIFETMGNIELDLFKSIADASVCISKQTKNSKSFAKLHCLHVKNELTIAKYERSIKQLELALKKRKKAIFDTMELSDVGDNDIDDKKRILLEIELAGQNAVYECLLKQLEGLQSAANFKIQLKEVQTKSLNMQQKLVEQMRRMYYDFTLFKKIHFSIHSTRDETFTLVRKLNQFTNNLCWTLPLTHKTNTNEIKMFKNFPLEYNRHIKLNGIKTFKRDLLMNAFNNEHADMNTLHMFVMLIQSPVNPPETVLLHLIQNKMKLGIYKSLQRAHIKVNLKKYSLEALQRQESYVQYAINKLNSLMKSCASGLVSLNVPRMEKMIALWLEMPMKNFVSPRRLFNNHNMEYYQCLYDSHYKELE